jgi:copper(I)-binding protein
LKDQIMKTLIVAAAAALTLATPAFAHNGLVHGGCAAGQVFTAGDLTISGAFTRAMLPNAKSGGAYFSIENKGSAADRLVGVSTAAAQLAQVHEMKMEGDVMKMGEVPGGLEIPAGGTVTLAPGGLHVMMMGVGVPFKEGECLELTLKFETAGDVPVVATIGGTAADAAPEHAGH